MKMHKIIFLFFVLIFTKPIISKAQINNRDTLLIVVDTVNKFTDVNWVPKGQKNEFSIYLYCDYQKNTEYSKFDALFIISNMNQYIIGKGFTYNKKFKIHKKRIGQFKLTNDLWIAKQDNLNTIVNYVDFSRQRKNRVYYFTHSSDFFNLKSDSIGIVKVNVYYGGVQIE